MAKQVAPPKVTGGGGFDFENMVAAYFLSCLLSAQPPLNPTLGRLSQVDFQTRVDGWLLDDILLTLVFGEETCRCALSVKSNQQFTGNAAPKEFVRLAWEQFLHAGMTSFNRDRDLLALAITPLPPKLAEELYELLSWVRAQPPESLPNRLTTPGFASKRKRDLFRSFACPEELAAQHGILDKNIGELLRCIRVLSFDFEYDSSTQLQSAVQNCRGVLRSGTLEEAISLWERLREIANEYRPHAGYLDLPRLLERLKSQFQLKDYPDHQPDWSCLHIRTRENLATIPDKIGNAVSLPREREIATLETAYIETRCIVLLGPSGCGKTVIAKLWAEGKLQAHKVLWWNAGSFDVQDFAAFEAALNLQYRLQELLEAVPDPLAYMVIDGLDRVSGVAFQNLSVFLQRLRLDIETSSWRVLITCQPEEWGRIRTELARANAPPVKWQVVEVKEPDADALSPVWDAFPALQHLARQGALQALLFKPKVLDLLAFRLSIDGAVDTRGWVGESDLIRWFWDTEVAKHPNGAVRSLFLMSLGEKQADDLHTVTPLDAFSLADLAPLHELCQDRICKQYEERLAFSHDLYGDWARQRKLLQQAETLHEYLESRLVSPLWHRAIRLYGLHLLEQDQELTRWRVAVQALAMEGRAGNLAQDLLLESVIFAAQPLLLLERLWSDLIANHGLLLRRLLGRFLHVATLPNPIITAVTKTFSPELETEAATLYRLPYWPYWLPIIQFLYKHQAEVIQLAPQHVAEIAGTWLQRGHASWVLRQETAELAIALAESILRSRQSGRFVYSDDNLVKSAYRAVLAGARELPERIAAFALKASGRAHLSQQESPNSGDTGTLPEETPAAIDFGASSGESHAIPWPDGPCEPVDAAFQDICLQENWLLPLITTAPSVAREVLLALLIEPPREDDPFWPGSRHNEHLNVEYIPGWYPPFYMRGPLFQFLHLHPTEGLEVVLRLVNFVTERWAARWVGQEPPGVTMSLPEGEAWWIGNHAMYYWYRDYPHCPHVVAVALMALEKWLYDAIDAQQPIHDILGTMLQRSRSVAFAGLLSVVARKEPSLFEGLLQPLLAVPEFYYWERWYSSQWDSASLMIGWWDHLRPFMKLVHDWHTLPHRRRGLHEWAYDLFRNAPQMRPFFEQARLQWIGRLQAIQENDGFRNYLENLIAQYDINNYEVQSHPEHGEVWEFTPPEVLRLKSEKLQRDTEEERQLLYFPIQYRQILDAGQPLPLDRLGEFWELLQRVSKFTPPTDDDAEGGRVEDAICGGVAVLLKFHRQWLRQHPAREDWCVQQLLTIIRQPPKAGRHYHESAHVIRKWDQFCAQVIPLLWVDDPDSPDLRECVALLASSHYYKTVEILFAAVAQHRHHLGIHFKQLQHFLLHWAAAKWKWQRSYYEEEARLALEAWRHREIQAFATQSMTAEVPQWEDVVVQMQSRQVRRPEYVKERRGIKKIRFQQDPGLDLDLIHAAYSWIPVLDHAVSESERTEWVGFWREALDCLLRRLGTDTEDEEEIPGTPYEVDRWMLGRIAALIPQLRYAEHPADFWEPIFSLGTPGHFWVQTFLREWFVFGLRSEPASDAFVREWRAMLEFAFASPQWNFDLVNRRYHLEEMWCGLMGFDSIYRDMWNVSQKPVIKHMYAFYERWADRCLHRPRCALAFIALLSRPAAEEILLDALIWLENAARQADDWFWNEHGLQEALVSFLDMGWRSYKGRLCQQEASFTAFKTLLKKLADFQNPMALEIQQRVIVVNDEQA